MRAATRQITRANKAAATVSATLALLLLVSAAASAATRSARVAAVKPACALLPLAVAERFLGTTAKEVPGGPFNCRIANDKLNRSNSITIGINTPETQDAFVAAHKGLVRVPGFGKSSACTTVNAGYDQCEVWSKNAEIIVSFDHRTRYTPGHNSVALKIPLSTMAAIYLAIVKHL